MNFLGKARRKAEEAVNEVRTAVQRTAPSQQVTSNSDQQHQQQYFQTPHPNAQFTQTPGQAEGEQQGFHPPPSQPFGTSTSLPQPQSLSSQWGQSQHQSQNLQRSGYNPPSRQSTWSSRQDSHKNQNQPASQPSFYPPPPPLPARDTISQQSSQIRVPSAPQSEELKCLASTPKLTKYKRFRGVANTYRNRLYTQFFNLKEKPSDSFGSCVNCYRREILPHENLVYAFQPYQTLIEETRFLCDFSYSSARAIIKSRCVPQNSIQPLLDFVTISETLSPCDGSTINTPGPYYSTKLEAIPSFAVCPTCFEFYLRHTPFEDKFESIPDGTYGGTNQWSCDLAGPFYKRLLVGILETDNPNFASFAEESTTRLALPPCPGPSQPITQFVSAGPLVFTAKDGRTGNLCFSCYCDCVSNTLLEDAFAAARLTEDQQGKISCDLAEPYSKLAMEYAINKNDDEVWREIVGKMGKVGQCRGKSGSDDAFVKEKEQSGDLAKWYSLNEAPSIAVCPHCYSLKILLFGAAHLFSPIARPSVPPGVLMCFLTGSRAPSDASTSDSNNFEDSMAWRGRRLFNSLELGYETGDWSQMMSIGRAISSELPPCGGDVLGFKSVSGRKWFGRIRLNSANPDDCTLAFCEECHARAVKGAPYESHYSNDLTEHAYQTEGTTGFVCQTYTNRSRGMLREAAHTGKFAEFAHWWNHRDGLRKKKDLWQPLIQQQLLKMQMANFQQTSQMMLKMNAQSNALQAIGSAGMVEAAMSDNGERWGNSQVGYDHWTRGSADAEQQWQNASHMKVGVGAGDLGLMGETQRLFWLAQQDENAFKAVE